MTIYTTSKCELYTLAVANNGKNTSLYSHLMNPNTRISIGPLSQMKLSTFEKKYEPNNSVHNVEKRRILQVFVWIKLSLYPSL